MGLPDPTLVGDSVASRAARCRDARSDGATVRTGCNGDRHGPTVGGIEAVGRGDDGQVRLWDVQTRQPLGEPLSPNRLGEIYSVAFSPDGTLLASASRQFISVWNVQTRHQIGVSQGGAFNDLGTDIRRIFIYPDNRTLLASDRFAVSKWTNDADYAK